MVEAREPGGAALLFVRGADEVGRHVYERRGFVYWSAAFDLILEKHGLLDFQTAGPEILDDPHALARYDTILMAWLPEPFWRRSWLAGLERFKGLVVMEGPLPEMVLKSGLAARLRDLGPGPEQTRRACEDFRFLDLLDDRFQDGNSGVVPAKKVLARRTESELIEELRRNLARDGALRADKAGFERFAAHLASLWGLSQRLRLERNGRFFPDPGRNLAAFYFWLGFIEGLEPGEMRDRRLKLTGKLARGIDSPENQGQKAARVCVLTRAAALLEGRDLELAAGREFEELVRDFDPARAGVEELAWFHLARVLRLSGQSLGRERRLIAGQVKKCLKKSRDPADIAAGGVVYLQACNLVRPEDSPLASVLRAAAGRVLARLERFFVRGLGLEESLTLALLLVANGREDEGRALAVRILEQTFDPQKAALRRARVWPDKLESSDTFALSPWLNQCVSGLAWRRGICSLFADPETDDSPLLRAWENPPEPDWSPLVREEGPTLDDAIYFTRVRLLSHIVHFHTMHPLPAPYFRTRGADQAAGLEHWLIDRVAGLMRGRGLPFVRVRPWPWGDDYCLSLRRDVDRVPDEKIFAAQVDFERENGLGASWYWLPGNVRSDYVKKLAGLGREIGLHALIGAQKEREKREIESHLPPGERVVGECWHGGGGGDNFRGHPSILRAVQAGMEYTEAGPVYDQPFFGFPFPDQSGAVRVSPVTCMTRGAPVDLDLDPDQEENSIKVLIRRAGLGAHLVLLSHPDLNPERLRRIVERLPARGRRNFTCAQAARWRLESHRRDNLIICRTRIPGGFSYTVKAVLGARDVELNLFSGAIPRAVDREGLAQGGIREILRDDSGLVRIRLALEPGERVEFEI